MTRRDFALLILILLLGAGITVAHRVRQGFFAPDVHLEGLEFLRGPLHTFTQTSEADLAPGDRVSVEAGKGDVQVLTWSEPKVRVQLKKQIHGEREEEAAKRAAELTLEMVPGPGSLLVRTAGTRNGGLTSEITVTVPGPSRLQVITDNRSVVVRGVGGDTLIKTEHGDVEAEDLGGKLEVVNDDGSINLRRIRGGVVLRTAHGDIEASDLEGTAEVSGRDGDITLSRVSGAARVTHAHGDVQVSGAGGGVWLNADNVDATLTDVHGSVQIVDQHGSVRVQRATGELKITAPHCEVQVENLEGGLIASVQGDPLTATSVKGGVSIDASASSVTLVDVQGSIQVTGTHTPVEVVRPGSDVTVDTTNQEVEIASPAAKGFRVDAKTEQGEVESDLAELHVPEERPSHFAGALGDGKIRYRLSTSHATISIVSSQSSRSKDDS